MATVRVRIAVAVDPSGSWCARGWHYAGTTPKPADQVMMLAVDSLNDCEARFWIEADVPVPLSREPTIQGVVAEMEPR